MGDLLPTDCAALIYSAYRWVFTLYVENFVLIGGVDAVSGVATVRSIEDLMPGAGSLLVGGVILGIIICRGGPIVK
jgi:hypothetical protein